MGEWEEGQRSGVWREVERIFLAPISELMLSLAIDRVAMASSPWLDACDKGANLFVLQLTGECSMHDARAIANRFIEMAREAGRALTPMQLLKLVYIAHGWMLGLYGVPLTHNRIEAWKFGPVIPHLYSAIRHYGDRQIIETIPSPEAQFAAAEESIMQQVFDSYGQRSGISLSNLTHRAGSPWHHVYREGELHTIIPEDIIQDHYSRLAGGPV